MNPLEFNGLKVEEDLYDFIDEVQKITQIIVVTLVKNLEYMLIS